MTPPGDPYRVLGLAPGASMDEVRRAYRRLAKRYHPDATGDGGADWFLVVQAAYESIVRGRPTGAVPRARARRPGARPAGRREGGRPAAGTGFERTGSPPGGSTAGRTDGDGSRGRRGTRAARPGSTSYDDAETEAAEPRWGGATWYGQSSGTYWTINPREYADPRKHGPEYLARGRPAAPPVRPDADPRPPARRGLLDRLVAAAGAIIRRAR